MKLKVILIALVCLAATPVPSAFAERTVEHGDHGRTVRKLQRLLHVHADGIFGKGTVRALKRFQRRHHLHADGVAGPSTWRMLKRSARRRAQGGVRIQRRGPSVRMLQRHLGISADGVYGPHTQRAVIRFQERHGIVSDGIVGPQTWQTLGIAGRHPVLKPARLRRAPRARAPGAFPVRVLRAIRAANRIAYKPYRFGGGHGSFDDSGYDCSGSVSYVLHGAGVLGSPLDSGSLMHWGAPGRGRYVTVYANAGHAFMMIGNRRYDTSMRGPGGSRWSTEMRSSAGYVARHPPGL
jgi:peptidoglycan hydrolase-like protein with peptidoglycan-binding domain